MSFTVFIFGLLAASFALLLELVILNLSSLHDYSSVPFDFSNLSILALAALIEEGSKYLFVRTYLSRFFEGLNIDPLKLLALGAFFGAGFAAIEVTLSLSGNPDPSSSDLLHILATAVLHVATSLVILFFLKDAARRSLGALFLPLSLAFALHMLYNVTLSFGLW